jgi:methylated-DNA-[protein]-cysteine S-methyltransferase
MTAHLSTTTVASPVGTLTLAASDIGLRGVLWPDDRRVVLGDVVDDPSHPVLVAAVTQLGEYFDGNRTEFDVPLDPVGTDFQRTAWRALQTIPYARTVSYGEQAARMGDRRKARAVGAANGRNPISIIVPCHRVVGVNGALTGFAGGVAAKSWLLDHEQRHVRASTG